MHLVLERRADLAQLRDFAQRLYVLRVELFQVPETKRQSERTNYFLSTAHEQHIHYWTAVGARDQINFYGWLVAPLSVRIPRRNSYNEHCRDSCSSTRKPARRRRLFTCARRRVASRATARWHPTRPRCRCARA
eukprot:2034290-Pleurochrysis_carterae.AAC.4